MHIDNILVKFNHAGWTKSTCPNCDIATGFETYVQLVKAPVPEQNAKWYHEPVSSLKSMVSSYNKFQSMTFLSSRVN